MSLLADLVGVSTRVAGTFSGTLAATVGANAPLTITGGTFDVRVLGTP